VGHYHEREDTHRTSKSRVFTPLWSIDLNLMVNGNGSFTVTPSSLILSIPSRAEECGRTYHKSTEKSIYPPHNQRLRNNHCHISLDHVHHLVHASWVSHRVGWRLSHGFRVLEVGARLILLDKEVLPRHHGGKGDVVSICPKVDTPEEVTPGKRGYVRCCGLVASREGMGGQCTAREWL